MFDSMKEKAKVLKFPSLFSSDKPTFTDRVGFERTSRFYRPVKTVAAAGLGAYGGAATYAAFGTGIASWFISTPVLIGYVATSAVVYSASGYGLSTLFTETYNKALLKRAMAIPGVADKVKE